MTLPSLVITTTTRPSGATKSRACFDVAARPEKRCLARHGGRGIAHGGSQAVLQIERVVAI